ncbi:hypothetical protein [Haloterrigena salifodinae]|uniref:hypothetical protein n=1 Tax=Haloterrigena salifodinae TaxID=2675099 RepID=UPI0013DF9F87|nr:hypothetical protein [Haloterrigena salifodinae]
MTDSGPRRRDVLVAVSGTSLLLAGCSESDASVDAVSYGTAYGRKYGHGGE